MPSKDNRHILRYARTDDVFDEIWQPVSNSGQDPASATLVAHDMYHHERADSGTYAQEVATFGAEFYPRAP